MFSSRVGSKYPSRVYIAYAPLWGNPVGRCEVGNAWEMRRDHPKNLYMGVDNEIPTRGRKPEIEVIMVMNRNLLQQQLVALPAMLAEVRPARLVA